MTPGTCPPFLRLSSDGRSLRLGEDAVDDFIVSGVSYAWRSWGGDLAGDKAHGYGTASYCAAEQAMRFVARNGGNTLRIFVFEEPATLLDVERQVDAVTAEASVRVVGLKPGVLSTAVSLLQLAEHYEVLLIFTLFNGRAAADAVSCALYGDAQGSLSSLLDEAIAPLASAPPPPSAKVAATLSSVRPMPAAARVAYVGPLLHAPRHTERVACAAVHVHRRCRTTEASRCGR